MSIDTRIVLQNYAFQRVAAAALLDADRHLFALFCYRRSLSLFVYASQFL